MKAYAQLAAASSSQGRAWLACLLAAASLAPAAALAGAMNKCVVDGKVSYQDTPCPIQPGAASNGIAPKVRAPGVDIRALERKLDRLQSQGKGMVQGQPPGPVEPPAKAQEDRVSWRPQGSREAEAARVSALIQEQTRRTNAESTAKLANILGNLEKACGGTLPHYPSVGMSDEVFRTCTVHARLGSISQIVAVDEDKVPLRLYVFRSEQARRVYSVGGVITKVTP